MYSTGAKWYAIGVYTVVIFLGLSSVARAATGDILSVTITEDGWYAEVVIEGFEDGGTYDYGSGLSDDDDISTIDNDITNAKMVFTVTSEGYDTSGTLGTIDRTIYGTKFVRKPYPDATSTNLDVPDESESGGNVTLKIALSDFVHDDDSLVVSVESGFYTDSAASGDPSNAAADLAVTNSSTLDYPKVIARWAWPGFDRATSTVLIEAVAVHRFAQNGKPVAAVVFEASDQSGNSVTQTVTDVTISERVGDEQAVLVYATTFDFSAFEAGDVVDINFTAYPWVGDANSVRNSRVGQDGVAQPSESLGPLHFINDSGGTYGVGYALVDSVSGDDGTGTVYASSAAAEAGNAYATIGNAASAIRTYHNSTFSRDNAGGGVILLAEGNHAYPVVRPSPDLGTTMDTWLIITRASGASKANTIISSGGNRLNGLLIKIEDVTISPSVSSGGGILGRAASDALWLHNNTINATNTTPFFAWYTAYATNNTVTELNGGFKADFGGTRGPFALVRGNDSADLITSHFYAVFGNNGVSGEEFVEPSSNPASHAQSSNSIFAYNIVNNIVNDLVYANTDDVADVAFVQNVFERTGSDPSGVFNVSSGGGNGGNASNMLFWHNTFVGARQQHGYNSDGSVSVDKLNWASRFNIFTEQGKKTDWFDDVTMSPAPNGVRVGNWPLLYGVGDIGNKSMKASYVGDFLGLYAQWGPTAGYSTPGFVSDQSYRTGTDTGEGNYRLVATSTAIDSASIGTTVYDALPFDILGNSRYGRPDTGAYEYQPVYVIGTNDISGSSTVRVYGDEKWRGIATSTISNPVDLQIVLPGSDTTSWVDIAVSTWDTVDGAHNRVWTESSPISTITDTVHTIGGFTAGERYGVKVDSSSDEISGDACTFGVCTANGSGDIVFTYTGTYSTHTFSVTELDAFDSVAPTIQTITSSTADGTYGAGETISIDLTFSEPVNATTSVTVTLETGDTDQACTFTVSATSTASCTYTVVEGDASDDLTVQSVSGYIEDIAGNAMVNFIPFSNIDDTKALVISASVPVVENSGVSSTSGGAPPAPPIPPNGFSVIANSISATHAVFTVNSISNTDRIVFSNNSHFEDAVYIPAAHTFEREAQAGDTFFLRFCTQSGGCSNPVVVTVSGFVDTTSVHQTVLESVFERVDIDRNLWYGISDEVVLALQKFLNAEGFVLAETGAGSPGNETSYFGNRTYNAVLRFQNAYASEILHPLGLSEATGYVGRSTRAKINMMK